tara:strand:+ start:1104 stop:1412 length:309 start_codon:yes stop_codon:yes gene_type:complete
MIRSKNIFFFFSLMLYSFMNILTPENTKITIYSTSWCGPCKMAKRFLTEKGFSFDEIDIEERNITREEMAAATKGTSVPQIVINDIPIGGFEHLLEYFKKNY